MVLVPHRGPLKSSPRLLLRTQRRRFFGKLLLDRIGEPDRDRNRDPSASRFHTVCTFRFVNLAEKTAHAESSVTWVRFEPFEHPPTAHPFLSPGLWSLTCVIQGPSLEHLELRHLESLEGPGPNHLRCPGPGPCASPYSRRFPGTPGILSPYSVPACVVVHTHTRGTTTTAQPLPSPPASPARHPGPLEQLSAVTLVPDHRLAFPLQAAPSPPVPAPPLHTNQTISCRPLTPPLDSTTPPLLRPTPPTESAISPTRWLLPFPQPVFLPTLSPRPQRTPSSAWRRHTGQTPPLTRSIWWGFTSLNHDVAVIQTARLDADHSQSAHRELVHTVMTTQSLGSCLW